jgi:hypothetical protein
MLRALRDAGPGHISAAIRHPLPGTAQPSAPPAGLREFRSRFATSLALPVELSPLLYEQQSLTVLRA